VNSGLRRYSGRISVDSKAMPKSPTVTAAATTGAAAAEHHDPDQLDAWVRVSRLSSHRAGLQRGSWRLYGRIGRRARAWRFEGHHLSLNVALPAAGHVSVTPFFAGARSQVEFSMNHPGRRKVIGIDNSPSTCSIMVCCVSRFD